jgi:hypothetical protein
MAGASCSSERDSTITVARRSGHTKIIFNVPFHEPDEALWRNHPMLAESDGPFAESSDDDDLELDPTTIVVGDPSGPLPPGLAGPIGSARVSVVPCQHYVTDMGHAPEPGEGIMASRSLVVGLASMAIGRSRHAWIPQLCASGIPRDRRVGG